MPHHNVKVYHVTATQPSDAMTAIKKQLPTTDIDRLFEIGAIWFGKQRLTQTISLKKGDTLRVYVSDRLHENSLLPTSIIAESKNWIVVDKPAGLSSVPDRSHLYDNMTAAVTNYLRTQGNHYEANPLTRLDLMTSGLMLYAKNKSSERYLAKEMLAHRIRKQYTTILQHTHTAPCQRITDTLLFTDKARVHPDGKPCHSLFVQQGGEYPIYHVTLFTGRRHQIRCHASTYLSPILGDTFYGAKKWKNGLALWASAYNFRDPSGKKVRIRLPDMDKRIQTFLNIPIQ